MEEQIFHGIGIGTGLSVGKLQFLSEKEKGPKAVPKLYGAEAKSTLLTAMQIAAEELEHIRLQTSERLGAEKAEIFEIHKMILEDADFLDAMFRELEFGKSAAEALEEATERSCILLAESDDAYLAARATDLRDVSERIKRAMIRSECDGGTERSDASDREADSVGAETIERPCFLVAVDLTPSQTVLLDPSKILGLITFEGSPNSHTAILARAMGIPALVGVGQIPNSVNGSMALLDAEKGSLTVAPRKETLDDFTERLQAERSERHAHAERLRIMLRQPAVTQSGHSILIYANIGSHREVRAALENGADGIGLLRSEFLYLETDHYPDEETLFTAYREVARTMGQRRSVIRTLDIGADKQIPYFHLPKEANPALGFRAIRVCLEQTSVFQTQLRAILRASAYGKISLMLPMIVSVEEVRKSKALLLQCMRELEREQIPFDDSMEIGIMIETPAAAVMSAELAKEVDFFSVGTNDLTQYTLAADRQDPRLLRLCSENNEPILRLIEHAAKEIHNRGGWIGICGEMAADLSLTQTFADLQIDELSVAVPSLPDLREQVRKCL